MWYVQKKVAEICQKLSLKLYSKRKVIVYLEGTFVSPEMAGKEKGCTHVEYNTRGKFCGNGQGRQEGEQN